MVSVATLGDWDEKAGPLHRTGRTPIRLQRARTLLSGVLATISPLVRLKAPLAMLMNHWATFSESWLMGRLNLMFVYLSRPGSWWTKRLFPPSSRCSTVTSMPRPSQLVNVPSDRLSTWKVQKTPTPPSMALNPRPVPMGCPPCRSMPSRTEAEELGVPAQLGP